MYSQYSCSMLDFLDHDVSGSVYKQRGVSLLDSVHTFRFMPVKLYVQVIAVRLPNIRMEAANLYLSGWNFNRQIDIGSRLWSTLYPLGRSMFVVGGSSIHHEANFNEDFHRMMYGMTEAANTISVA